MPGYGGGARLVGEALLERVEISENQAERGAGVYTSPESGATAGLMNVTISGNSGLIGAGIVVSGSGDTATFPSPSALSARI